MGQIVQLRDRRPKWQPKRSGRAVLQRLPYEWLGLAIVGVLVFSAQEQAKVASPPVSHHGSDFEGTVTKVIDGDTIKVAGHESNVRLFGVDAAEMNTTAGKRAKRRMVLMAEGQYLRCDIRDQDKYGRSAAICTTRDGRDIGHLLITGGYAREYCHFSRDFYGTCS